MKAARTENAIRNIVFGVLYKAESIVLPFLIRTAMIYIMGSQYVGLGSLFTSILSFLNLAELGVGSALVHGMYAPIATGDEEKVCALLNLYRTVYRYIGMFILIVGLLLLPFLKKIVGWGYPEEINIYVLYLVYLLNTVISYLMYGYKQSLLVASQRSDIISKITMVSQTIQSIAQLITLLLFKNYYLYCVFMPVFTVVTNAASMVIVNRMYPQYTCRGEVGAEEKLSIKKKVVALIGIKANAKVMYATDNICIAAVLGLSAVGIYGNYFYIMNSIIGITTIICDSFRSGVGNSLAIEDKEKNYIDFKVLTFLNIWLVVFCSVCLLCLYQPFMHLWVGPERMLNMDIVVFMVVYFFVYQMRRIVLTYKDAAGIWWEDLLRPYVMMVVKLTLSVVLVRTWGMKGVLISTIISMLVSVPWENYMVFKLIFEKSSKAYYLKMAKYLLVAVWIATAIYFLCLKIPYGWGGLVVRAMICIVFTNALFVLVFGKTQEYKRAMDIVKNRLFKA